MITHHAGDPTNLLAVLKIIADLWRVEQQNRHAAEIAEKAGNLYDNLLASWITSNRLAKNCRMPARRTTRH